MKVQIYAVKNEVKTDEIIFFILQMIKMKLMVKNNC